MNCWLCEGELSWDSCVDQEENEKYPILTVLTCPDCRSLVEVYHPYESVADD